MELPINRFKDGKFENGTENFFPEKMKNLHGCEVRLSVANESKPSLVVEYFPNETFILSGKDFKLISTIAESLNFKINTTFIGPYGYFLLNGTAQGALKGLLDNKADLSISNWLLKLNRLPFLDVATSHYNDALVFIIPPGAEIGPLEKLIYPFQTIVWIAIIACYLIGTVVIIIIKKQPVTVQDLIFGENVRHPHWNHYMGILGGGQDVLPNNFFARFILMMFLIYTLVIRTAFQGLYFELMQSDGKHKEAQSIDDMIARDYKFHMTLLIADNFQKNEKMNQR
jgi:hypothetical protein